jgi:hypothetical protein
MKVQSLQIYSYHFHHLLILIFKESKGEENIFVCCMNNYYNLSSGETLLGATENICLKYAGRKLIIKVDYTSYFIPYLIKYINMLQKC